MSKTLREIELEAAIKNSTTFLIRCMEKLGSDHWITYGLEKQIEENDALVARKVVKNG